MENFGHHRRSVVDHDRRNRAICVDVNNANDLRLVFILQESKRSSVDSRSKDLGTRRTENNTYLTTWDLS
jgi:hypothetical protein